MRERVALQSRALLGLQLLADLLIGELRILDLVDQRLARHELKVSVLPGVVGDFKHGVGHELLRALAM